MLELGLRSIVLTVLGVDFGFLLDVRDQDLPDRWRAVVLGDTGMLDTVCERKSQNVR